MSTWEQREYRGHLSHGTSGSNVSGASRMMDSEYVHFVNNVPHYNSKSKGTPFPRFSASPFPLSDSALGTLRSAPRFPDSPFHHGQSAMRCSRAPERSGAPLQPFRCLLPSGLSHFAIRNSKFAMFFLLPSAYCLLRLCSSVALWLCLLPCRRFTFHGFRLSALRFPVSPILRFAFSLAMEGD